MSTAAETAGTRHGTTRPLWADQFGNHTYTNPVTLVSVSTAFMILGLVGLDGTIQGWTLPACAVTSVLSAVAFMLAAYDVGHLRVRLFAGQSRAGMFRQELITAGLYGALGATACGIVAAMQFLPMTQSTEPDPADHQADVWVAWDSVEGLHWSPDATPPVAMDVSTLSGALTAIALAGLFTAAARLLGQTVSTAYVLMQRLPFLAICTAATLAYLTTFCSTIALGAVATLVLTVAALACGAAALRALLTKGTLT